MGDRREPPVRAGTAMKEILRRYIAQELLSDRQGVVVHDDDDLLGSWSIDSVGMMSLVLFIEEEFRLPVPPEDVTIDNFVSINAIDAYLRHRQS
jgi:acyl carrier protein